jgi:hypothetical protein
MGRRGVTSKAVGSVADDAEGRELYLGIRVRIDAWLRLPDEARCAQGSPGTGRPPPSYASLRL